MTSTPTPVSARVTAWVEELAQAHAAAWAELVGLCDGSRRWTMRVPVDEGRDSDTVFAAALNGQEALLAVVRGVAEFAEELDSATAPLRYAYDSTARWHGEQIAAVAARLRRLLADAAPDTEKETDR